MLPVPLRKGSSYRKQKMKSFGNHEEYLARIAKSLYYVDLPRTNSTSLPVTELAAEIFSEANKFSLNRLDIEKAAYLSRNACVSPCSLVLAILYLERLKASNPKYLTKVSPTELFIISLMIGSKFLQDAGEGDELSNTEWANITGLTVQEINKAEKQFLDAINWKVFVSKEEFWNMFKSLETKVGLKQGFKRGWFTYTELNMLLQLIDLSTALHCIWNVTSACFLSYPVSVLALVGSALLVGQIPGLGLKPKVPMTDVSHDWTNASSSLLTESVLPHSTGIQDCNASFSTELRTDTNTSNTDFLNLCQPRCILEEGSATSDSIHLALLYRLYVHLSHSTLIDVDNLINTENVKDSSGLFGRGFSVWTWSEYIKSYLRKNSIPASLYPVASF